MGTKDGPEPRWLKMNQIVAAHGMLIEEYGGDSGIRDRGLLESAINRPRDKYYYGEPSIFEMAAAYAYGLCNNHGFVDGNKRIGATAAAMFLALNGYGLQADQTELVVMMEGLASGETGEDVLAGWIEENVAAEPEQDVETG